MLSEFGQEPAAGTGPAVRPVSTSLYSFSSFVASVGVGVIAGDVGEQILLRVDALDI